MITRVWNEGWVGGCQQWATHEIYRVKLHENYHQGDDDDNEEEEYNNSKKTRLRILEVPQFLI